MILVPIHDSDRRDGFLRSPIVIVNVVIVVCIYYMRESKISNKCWPSTSLLLPILLRIGNVKSQKSKVKSNRLFV